MSLASSSSLIVRAIKETVFGVTPVAGNPMTLRVKGESLQFDITKTPSTEINDTRTISGVMPTSANASGGLMMEMRAIGLEDFMESALQSTFVKFGTAGLGVATATGGISATAITATVATSGSSAFTSLAAGQTFRIVSSGVNNGKIVRVHASTAATTTVLTVDPSTPLAVSAGESIQIQSARLTHGVAQTSFTVEKLNSDIGVFIAFRGMTPNNFNMKIASGTLSEASFEFMGKDGLESSATSLPGTPIPADAFDIHSGVSGATNAVWLDGVPVSGTFAKSVDLSFGNALRAQDAIGTLGSVGVGSGTIECTVNMQIYFADKNQFTKFRTNVNQSISFATTDAAGNGYMVSLPACNLSSWKSNAGAKDQDQMVDLTFMALRDAGNANVSLRKAIFIDRVGVTA